MLLKFRSIPVDKATYDRSSLLLSTSLTCMHKFFYFVALLKIYTWQCCNDFNVSNTYVMLYTWKEKQYSSQKQYKLPVFFTGIISKIKIPLDQNNIWVLLSGIVFSITFYSLGIMTFSAAKCFCTHIIDNTVSIVFVISILVLIFFTFTSHLILIPRITSFPTLMLHPESFVC